MKSARIFLLGGGLFFLAFSSIAYADVPQRMNYQGKITTPGGALVDTTIQMVFSIYATPTAVSALWSETHPAVVVQKGIFSVVLGMQNPLDSDDFHWLDSLYLGVKVGADPEMTPRKQIVSSGYALTDGDWWESGGDLYRYEGDVFIGPPIFRSADMEHEDYQGTAKLEVFGDYECAIYGYVYPSYYSAGEQYEYYGAIGDVYTYGEVYNFGVFGCAGGSGAQFALYGIAEGGYLETTGGSAGQYTESYGLWAEAYDYNMACGLYGYAGGGESVNFGAMTMAEAYPLASQTAMQVPEANLGLLAEAGAATYTCGVYAYADGGAYSWYSYGIYAGAYGPEESETYAGYFDGDIYVDGSVVQPLAAVQLDHPLYPEDKYLQHSLVESPDMMNVHNGNVILDANGEAIVELPAYFEALNKDFRYQLTCIGGFAPVYVAQKISGNQFTIAGGEQGMEVSWQVTGIRNDPFAEANRIQVEVDKPAKLQGKYLHPKAYGLGKEYATSYELHKKIEEQQQRTLEQQLRSKEQHQRQNEQREQRKLLLEKAQR